MSKLPEKNCFLLGDYNVDLLNLTLKAQLEYEEIIISNGYTPVISISTNHQAGCKKSCIDNILTNLDPKNIIASGKLSTAMSSHSGIFQISNIGFEDKNENKKIKIEYEYSNTNIKNFVDLLEKKLSQEQESFEHGKEFIQNNLYDIYPENANIEVEFDIEEEFSHFLTIFQSCIDKTCKLAKPKTTKRNKINNPWITLGIINSIITNDKLYQDWKDSFKEHNEGDENLKLAHRKHQDTLRWVIKNAKQKFYAEKFDKCKGDKKQTWKLINEIRGNEKQVMKPSFIIDSERIYTRRIIADKFNKYFVKLAFNLNQDAYGTIPIIEAYPSFESYLSQSQELSMLLEDTNPSEIYSIITELKSGKSSDIPIMLLKAANSVVAPYISKLYNSCMANGIFPKAFKLSRITPIYKKGNKELIENYRPAACCHITYFWKDI